MSSQLADRLDVAASCCTPTTWKSPAAALWRSWSSKGTGVGMLDLTTASRRRAVVEETRRRKPRPPAP